MAKKVRSENSNKNNNHAIKLLYTLKMQIKEE